MMRSSTRCLLRLLTKINDVLRQVEEERDYMLPPKYDQRRLATKQLIIQQSEKFYLGVMPNNRIASLDKPYIRPIVSGKEIKKVEFGAKISKL